MSTRRTASVLRRTSEQPGRMTFAELLEHHQTGIVVTRNDRGNVVLFRCIEGQTEWLEELEPALAVQIGECLVEEGRKK